VQGRGYVRALGASSSYFLKKKNLKNLRGKVQFSLFCVDMFCDGGVLKDIFKCFLHHLIFIFYNFWRFYRHLFCSKQQEEFLNTDGARAQSEGAQPQIMSYNDKSKFGLQTYHS
jgi:hypothetical protein